MKMDSGVKKAERVERKKKKLHALLEITKLNDKDRLKDEVQNLHVQIIQNNNDETLRDENEDNIIISEGPECKRHKTNHGDASPCVSISDTNMEKGNKQSPSRPILSCDELIQLRKKLREKRDYLKGLPRMLLNEMGSNASLTRSCRTPLFISDIQHVLLHSQLGFSSPVKPRWCSLEKVTKISHTVIVIVEGVSVNDYKSLESKLSTLSGMNHKLEFISPLNYGGNLVEELGTIPLSRTKKEKLERKYGNLYRAEVNVGTIFRVLSSIFPITLPPCQSSNKKNNIPATDRFPRTDLLLSAWQMIDEGYPIPVQGELKERFSDYVMSKTCYAEVTPTSPMWGLDCEMCLTSANLNELTRVSIVNENHEVVYESLVKPSNKIVNYLTKFSGITKEIMKNVSKTLESVQIDLCNLLPPDVILVGQSLNFDLHALKMMHPYVIDTSVIYNLSGFRPRKSKLSVLTETFLGEQIQQGFGHDSVEDSISSLKLVQLKLANSVEFGDAVLSGDSFVIPTIPNNRDDNEKEEIFATSLFSHVTKDKKTAVVIGKNDIISQYKPLASIPCLDEKTKTSRVVCQSVESNEDGISFTCSEAMYNSFLVTHLRLESDESLIDVDRWCCEILQSLAHNAFFMIILASSPNAKSYGACMVHTKKALINPNIKSSNSNLL